MINRHLTEAEQAALWRRHWRGDGEARSRLIERYSYLVPLTVQKSVPHVPAVIEFADLLSEGYIGLIRAVDRFDPKRGVKFRSLAISLIRCACLEYLRAEDWVPRSVRDAAKRGEDVSGKLLVLISLDDLLRHRKEEEREEDFRRLDLLADPRPGPEEIVADQQMAALLHRLVQFLPRIEREVIEAFFWRGEIGQDTAKRLSRSESRIEQHRNQALARLAACARASGAFLHG